MNPLNLVGYLIDLHHEELLGVYHYLPSPLPLPQDPRCYLIGCGRERVNCLLLRQAGR